jgi:hypothetical protein
MFLESRVEARSNKDFFSTAGVINSFPLSISEAIAIVKCCEIRSLNHALYLPARV